MLKYRVNTTILNVRKSPSVESEILGHVIKGQVLDVLELTGNWARIQNGFVHLKFIDRLSFSDLIIEKATSQIGVEEVRPNWGPEVKQYLASVGINFPASWCMAFVYWVVDEVCRENSLSNPLFKTGGVLLQWQRSVGLRLPPRTTPQKGDIFIMDFGRGNGHTGFVTDVRSGNRIGTIEGNSNDEGSREGKEVCRKPGGRPIGSCIGFLRLMK